jgi:hypothetical protein
MKSFLLLLTTFFTSAFKERCELALENLALRQQLAVLKRERKRLVIKKRDRLFWVCLSSIWKGWREPLIIIKPDTVIGWHRQASGSFGRSCRGVNQADVLPSIQRSKP